MRYYPVNLDLRNRLCLVVGGGAVATRKVMTLIDCGACVTVVSPQTTPALKQLAKQRQIELIERDYQSSDLDRMFLVIGATDNQKVNAQIDADAKARHMLCNIADQPHLCNFILPAIVARGDLVIAISTSGQSPALAKMLRKRLEIEFGTEYAQLLTLMGALRQRLLAEEHAPEAHKHLFEQLLEADLLQMIQDRRPADIDALLQRTLGEDFTLNQLVGDDFC